MRKIIINKDIFGYKAAITENGKVMEIFIEKYGEGDINGNIYKGKVSNVIPGMDSAFINIGLEKNGFLCIDDLKKNETSEQFIEKKEGIKELLKIGEELIVQTTTEPNGNKGPRLTTQYTVPGKFLVLIPNSDQILVSKKITDLEERERLEKIIEEIKPEGFGVILRTQAAEKSVFHFEKELHYLMDKWYTVERKIKNAKVGDVIYRDNDLIKKIARDIYSKDIDEIIINNEEIYWEFISYINTFGDNSNLKRVKLYEESEDIFDRYKVTEVIKSSLEKIVWLECGGYLVIETTEALTTIDINTGKNIGKNIENEGLEVTTYKTNMEAAREIPRQLMLRNIGGIIIIDFIDMKLEDNKIRLLEELEINLKKDRVKNGIVHFTDLNLIEMTRKRVGNPLSHYFYDVCPLCEGKGKIKSSEALVEDILREIREITKDPDFSTVKIIAKEDLYKKIKSEYIEFINAYLDKKKIKLELEKHFDNFNKWYEIILQK